MKKILLAIACLWAACISCSEDTKIGAPDEILPDYVLPQGDASKEANDRIQQIFDTYTSYVLYNYTEKDALWTQTAAGGGVQIYRAIMGESRHVDAMLDYIQAIWLQFFPEEFLKNLEEKKINPFQMTYQDGTYLYMAVGYGEQKTGGYSILVKKLTETKDKIFLNTELRGPSKEETVLEKPSFPYVVIKIENISKEVVFEAH